MPSPGWTNNSNLLAVDEKIELPPALNAAKNCIGGKSKWTSSSLLVTRKICRKETIRSFPYASSHRMTPSHAQMFGGTEKVLDMKVR